MNDMHSRFTIPLARHPGYSAHIQEAAGGMRVFFAAQAQGMPDQADSLLDVRQPWPPATQERPALTVYLILTELCNLRCRYCDVLDKIARYPDRQVMSGAMAQAALTVVLGRLARDPGLKTQIVFFGGEPLLNWPVLTGLCETVAAHPFAARIEKMLVTNGLLLDREKAEFLARHHVYTVVSLDGRADANDIIRRKPDGSGSFAGVAAGLRRLMDAMPGAFGISCTVGVHNAATLPDELRFMQETFQPCSIGINLYHYLADGGNPAQVDEAAQVQAFLDSFHAARESGIAIYQFVSVLRAFISRRRNREYCPACGNKLLFTPRGFVGRCETLVFYAPFAVPLADLVAGELPPRLDWSQYTPEHEPVCQSCAARWICPGSCVYDQFVRTGALGGVDAPRRCAFHRQLLRDLLDLLLEAVLVDAPPGATFLIPEQRHFENVVGKIPMSFPEHTL